MDSDAAARRPEAVGGRADAARAAHAARVDPLDQTLAALAEPQRRAIVEALREGELRPSELADRLAISRPALSRHLRVLRQAGLVSQQAGEPDARARPIRLQPARLGAVRHWLETVEAFWADQLGAFKRHAERPASDRGPAPAERPVRDEGPVPAEGAVRGQGPVPADKGATTPGTRR